MPMGSCYLCGNSEEIQLGHSIPAFVFRWLRESAGDKHFRGSDAPYLRTARILKDGTVNVLP